ncbi:MAG: hypothetical protein COU72_00600 [Parcubacteria group bacterium CG10_big_fil_rev_8_21_14_0_10_41_35]|nr:MAG: hypothetical protein COU72_00600 [Parcubacteria group bacterium CG10_big_fil_rev_8_21_14_0_10_41_35]
MNQNNVDSNVVVKKDKMAVLSFWLGVISIFFGVSIGMIPLVAIILGAVGINNTKNEGAGRWMAIVGLILGVIFLLSNAYTNNHLGFRNSDTKETTPKLQETTNLVARLTEMKRISDEEFEISAEITNVSDKPIRAFKGTVYVDSIFDEFVTGITAVRTDPLQPGGKMVVSEKMSNFHSSDYRLDGYEDLVEAGSIENLKIKILIEEIVF